MAITAPRVLLFDLGGVLVDWVGLRELKRLLPTPLAEDDIQAKWRQSAAMLRFETGGCSAADFARDFTGEWGIDLDPVRFLAIYRDWVAAPYPGIPQLLKALRSRYTLACLSNTNAVHWEKVQGFGGVVAALDRCFLSHELGVMKPSPEIYRHVVAELGVTPGEIVFFDDGQANVDAAREVGLSAHRTLGPDDLCRALVQLGALEPHEASTVR